MTPVELLLLFFVFVLAVFGLAGYIFVLRPQVSGGDAGIPAPIALDSRTMPAPQAAVADFLRLIGEAIPGGVAKATKAHQLLMQSGYRWPSAVSIFVGIKCASAVMLAVACVWITFIVRGDVSGVFLPAICGLGFGYLLPDRVLERLARARVARLRRALPSALDLMVLAIEAGQGLDAAILDTSRGLRVSFPDMATEFTQLHLELRANASREEALRNFAERAHDSELRKFVALLIDTDRFGSSLGPALRTHAKYLRVRFRQTAQERARKVGVKLIFPVFFLIFPSVILVTLGPAAIMLFTQLKVLLAE